jgi:hypothetical protein
VGISFDLIFADRSLLPSKADISFHIRDNQTDHVPNVHLYGAAEEVIGRFSANAYLNEWKHLVR